MKGSFFSAATNTTTFDYLYEFSETRKVLEDFFKCPNTDEDKKISDCFNESDTGSFVSLSLSLYVSVSLRTMCPENRISILSHLFGIG